MNVKRVDDVQTDTGDIVRWLARGYSKCIPFRKQLLSWGGGRNAPPGLYTRSRRRPEPDTPNPTTLRARRPRIDRSNTYEGSTGNDQRLRHAGVASGRHLIR
eukprot:scaffold74050_cov37-Tisochrysis_lutea.AAC.4